MKGRHYSICLDIDNFVARTEYPIGYRNVFIDDSGKTLSPSGARAFLLIERAKGRKVIPCSSNCGNPCKQPGCTGFDYSGRGCPGYEITDDTDEVTQ